MRIKDKKRFMIACSGLAAIVLIVIMVLTISITRNSQAKAADTKQNAQTTAVQTTSTSQTAVTAQTTAKETETVSTQQPTTVEQTAPAETKEEVKTANTTNTTSTDSITMLVNKNHSISASYIPADLVTVDLPSTRDTQLRSVAAEGLTKLFNAASSAGLELYCCSGYRSYETQSGLYAGNVESLGVDGAELVSARPGMSEHQLGLAMDVTSASVGFDLSESFGSTPEGQFINNNAYKYGFIVRYQQGKTDITGYAYEPWHLRYVGVDVATDIYNSGKTMEEYYGVN